MKLKDRILDISYRHKLSHIGSCLTAVNIIDAVYTVKNEDEKFVLSAGHSALALYVVLEKHFGVDPEFLVAYSGVHPDRLNTMTKSGSVIDCSTGSLGQGLPIAVGMALADRNKRVYCLISDGECSEGSIWEALSLADEKRLKNLSIIINVNGLSAYKKVEGSDLYERFKAFGLAVDIVGDRTKKIQQFLCKKTQVPTVTFVRTSVEQYPFLQSIDAHYRIMTEEEYNSTKYD